MLLLLLIEIPTNFLSSRLPPPFQKHIPPSFRTLHLALKPSVRKTRGCLLMRILTQFPTPPTNYKMTYQSFHLKQISLKPNFPQIHKQIPFLPSCPTYRLFLPRILKTMQKKPPPHLFSLPTHQLAYNQTHHRSITIKLTRREREREREI